MDAASILAAGAVACAGIAGFLFARIWLARDSGRKSTILASHDRSLRLVRALQRGCPPLLPVARRLLDMPVLRRATADLTSVLARRMKREEAEGAPVPELEGAAVLSLVLASALLVCAVVSAVMGSVVCGIACMACIVLVLFARARAAEEKHVEAVREEVPEALRSMGVCFRSGLSLLQTLKQAAHELDGSLGRLFDTAARRLEMGATTTEALAVFDTARQVPELTFVAVALDAQHQSGGSIAAVLESAQESVENELELRRSLRVQTAQAKLSARIVTIMPFLLVALFSLMSPGFLEPFFTSIAGMALLVLALGMQTAGTLAVHRMLRTSEDRVEARPL